MDYVDWMYKRELTSSGVQPLPPLPPLDMEVYVDDDLEKLPNIYKNTINSEGIHPKKHYLAVQGDTIFSFEIASELKLIISELGEICTNET
mgnify:CR=1 FL=1